METYGPLLTPSDEHNTELLSHVHPPNWENPDPKPRYHLVVIGGGTAGLVSAIIAAGAGAKVALVERHLMGGDCLNVGCVPSKAVISAARVWHQVFNGERFGAPPHIGTGDFGVAMRRMRELRARISPVDGAPRYRDLGIDVFFGQGEFVDPRSVEVAGKRLEFRRAVIATGARASAPPIPGLEEAGYLTNETIFSLVELPKRLGVIGGGPIGCELAQAFARFGCQVTLFDIAPHVLPREDVDAAAIVQESLRRDSVRLELPVELLGVKLDSGARVVRFERNGEEREIKVDKILVSAGRAPNVEGMGLEKARVQFNRKGIVVNDGLRTTNRAIYACGDVASPYQFTHAADAMARIVVQNALFPGRGKASQLVIPWCTYTSPEVAHVGLYAKEAEDRGIAVDTFTVPLSEVDRAILEGDDEGFLRLHVKKGSDQIVGATLVASHAGDMIGELCLAITHKVGLKKIAATIHPYPTQGEIIRKAASEWNKTRLTKPVKKFLAAWLAVFK